MPLPAPDRPSRRRRRWTLAFAYTALVASCDSPFASQVEEVVRLEINPSVLTMVVGGNVTLTARVYGAGDNLLPTARVHWSSQNQAVVTITQEGVATAVAAGTAQIAASAGGQSRTIAVTVSQQPIALVRISPPAGNVTVGGTLALQGEALDGTGALLPNRLLEWTSSAPEIATVNGTGVVSGVSVGEATISATGEGKTGTALVTVLPTPIATIDIEPNGGSLPAGATRLFVATPRDASGQALTGRTLEWRSSNDAVATVSSSGLLTAISPGTVTVTVSAPGGGPNGTTPSDSVDVTVLIEPVASAVLVPATASVQIGQTVDFTVNLFNGAGDPLSTAGRTVAWSSSNASVATINSSGRVTGVAVGTVTITATVTTPGQPGSVQVSAAVNILPGTATLLVFTTPPPSSANSGQVFSTPTVVQLRDASGNNVPQAGVTVTAAVSPSAGVTLGGGSATTNLSGTATFGALNLNGPAGSYTLTFNSGAVAPPLVSGPIALAAGSGSTLALSVQPSATAQSGVAFTTQPQVRLQDGSGNPVNQNGVVVTAAILTGGGTLGGTTTASTNASGVATFSGLSITGTVGPRTLLFGASGYTTASSNPIDITPGPAASLALTAQPSATAQSGVPFASQPVVQLQDESGNAVAQGGVTVSVSVNGTGAALIGSGSAITNSSGVATFSGLGLSGTTGSYSLSFSASGLTGVTSTSISLMAGPAAQLTMATQPSASVSSGSALATPPAVQLQDAGGNAVSQAGVSISVAISGSGASLTGATTAMTDASGIATFTGLGISGTAGSYTLQFSSAGLTGTTSSAIAVTSGAAVSLAMAAQPPGSALSGAAFSSAPAVQLLDGSGSAVSQAGVAITAAVTGGGATLVGSTTVNTNASGVATFSDLGITGAGTWTIDFASTGLTGVTSSAVVVMIPASQLSMESQPSATAQSEQAFAAQPSVRLRDSGGNPVAQTGVTVSAEITGGGGGASLLGAASALTDASGIASFTNLGIAGPVGSYTLTFKASGLTDAVSNSIDLAAGAAAKLSITQQPSGTTSDSPFTTQPIIQLRDAQDNPVSTSGVTVTATLNGTGGTLVGTAAVATNSSGQAGFTNLGISGSGTFTITFGATGLTGATSQDISIAFLNLSQAQPAIMDNTTADQMVMGGGTLLIGENTVGVPGFRIVSVGSTSRVLRRWCRCTTHQTPDTDRP